MQWYKSLWKGAEAMSKRAKNEETEETKIEKILAACGLSGENYRKGTRLTRRAVGFFSFGEGGGVYGEKWEGVVCKLHK